MTSKGPFGSQNTLYTLSGYPPKPQIWSVLLYDQPFSRCQTFYNSISTLTTMLKPHAHHHHPQKRKNKNICQNSKISNYTIILALGVHMKFRQQI